MTNNAWLPIKVVFGESRMKFQRQTLWYTNLYGKFLCMFFLHYVVIIRDTTSILELDLLYKYVYYSYFEENKTEFFLQRIS